MKRRHGWAAAAVALCLLLCGCGGGPSASSLTRPGSGGGTESRTTSSAVSRPAQTAAPAAPAAPLRPNDPQVLEVQSPGTVTVGDSLLTIDCSNAGQGYITVRYTGTAEKSCVLLTGPDGIQYKYFLAPAETFATLPLSGGSGAYTVDGYEHIGGNQYATLFKETIQGELEDELLPFLYPNLYVDFSAESQAVKKAAEVVQGAPDDLGALERIYHYVVENVTYDQEKAENLPSGYLPDIDETLATGKGICFDYASLTAAMLRSQGIPTKLEIGYAGKVYHAWISVYLEDKGWIDRIIEFTGDGWTHMDPTFASSSHSSENILRYIGDGSNYTTQYSR